MSQNDTGGTPARLATQLAPSNRRRLRGQPIVHALGVHKSVLKARKNVKRLRLSGGQTTHTTTFKNAYSEATDERCADLRDE